MGISIGYHVDLNGGFMITALPQTVQGVPEVDDDATVMWGLTAGVVSFLVYNVISDKWLTLDQWADAVERTAFEPVGLTWHNLGNPASWVHHSMICASAVGLSAAAAALTGAVLKRWARRGGWACVGVYVVREVSQLFWPRTGYRENGISCIDTRFPYTSRGCESFFDVFFPALTVWRLTIF